MNRYTTDKPESNVLGYRNFAFIKDSEVYLRGVDNGEDISLDSYCKKQCKIKCDADYSDIPVDEFAEYMDCDCPISALYFAALGAAELRERLSQYEDTGLEPEEIKPVTININKQSEDVTIKVTHGDEEEIIELRHNEYVCFDIECNHPKSR